MGYLRSGQVHKNIKAILALLGRMSTNPPVDLAKPCSNCANSGDVTGRQATPRKRNGTVLDDNQGERWG